MQWNRASYCEFDGKSMKTEATTSLKFLNGGKSIVEQIIASEEINKSKRAIDLESDSQGSEKEI